MVFKDFNQKDVDITKYTKVLEITIQKKMRGKTIKEEICSKEGG